jgi:flavin-dependent dehydrogenase
VPFGGYDVVVVGAGPAGAATARRLAAAGRSVAVLERSNFDRPRTGETLAPSVQPLLRDLGVWERFCRLGPLPSWGNRSVWGDRSPVEHSHLASGYGSGWHVDRQAFDRMLAEAAADAGADLRTGETATGWRFTGTRWEVAVAGAVVPGRFLVDATGRRAVAGRALGAHRVVFDRLTAIAGTWTGADLGKEQYLLVETAPDGWWYTAPLPGGALPGCSLVGMLMTDADLCRRDGLAGRGCWHKRLRSAPVTAARVGEAYSSSELRVHPAASHRLLRHGDPRPWIAVGDATLAVDPATGSGVPRALCTAEGAAAVVGEALDGRAGVLAAYESARDEECTAYLTERANHYAAERRFSTPFWQRRARSPGVKAAFA